MKPGGSARPAQRVLERGHQLRQRIDRGQHDRRAVGAEGLVELLRDRRQPQVDRPLALDALGLGAAEAAGDVDAEERDALVLELELEVEVDQEAHVGLPQRVEAEHGLDAEVAEPGEELHPRADLARVGGDRHVARQQQLEVLGVGEADLHPLQAREPGRHRELGVIAAGREQERLALAHAHGHVARERDERDPASRRASRRARTPRAPGPTRRRRRRASPAAAFPTRSAAWPGTAPWIWPSITQRLEPNS